MTILVSAKKGAPSHGAVCACQFCHMDFSAGGAASAAAPGASLNPAWASNPTASNGKVILTTAQVSAQLNRYGVTWPVARTGPTTITFSFYGSNPGTSLFPTEGRGFSAFSAAQKVTARQALSEWAAVANIRFVEVGNPAQAQIKFGNTTTGPAQAWAYMPSTYYPQGGSVWINPRQASNLGANLNPGGYGLFTLVHEIGHALGLSHAGDYDYSRGMPTYARDAQYFQDSWQYTVMSYFRETNTGANYGSSYCATPQLSDVAAIQALYGAATGTRAGNTVYGFNCTAGDSVFDFKVNKKPVVTIYDKGGMNTLDLSGFSTTNYIDLREGMFSSAGGLTNNIAIAVGTQFHRAVGGSGNDTLIANHHGDTLWGGLGTNSFYGGVGNDTFIGAASTNTYNFRGAYGRDVVQQDLKGKATLSFDVARSQLGFTRSGADLLISKLNSADSVLVRGYYTKTSAFTFLDGVGTFTASAPAASAAANAAASAGKSSGSPAAMPVSLAEVTGLGTSRTGSSLAANGGYEAERRHHPLAASG